jgi:hypothetical protein
MTDVLMILLPYMMRFLKDPKANWYLVGHALIGFVADIGMNNLTVPIFIGGGWFQEWTFSTRLERLCETDFKHPDKQLFVQIALKINREAGFPHIQNAVQYEVPAV